MRNFIAVQTFAWGAEDKEPAAVAAYEVRIVDGYQRFREYPDGNQEFRDVPFPPLNTMIVPGGEWSELPEIVGTRLGLRIHQAPDAVVNERRIKSFSIGPTWKTIYVSLSPSRITYWVKGARPLLSLVMAKSGPTRIRTSCACQSITSFPASGKTIRLW